MRAPAWDDPAHWRAQLLVSGILLVDAGLLLSAGLQVVGIAGLVVAAAMAVNAVYLRAVNTTGTVHPLHLRARSAANAGYLAALVTLAAYNVWRVDHEGDLGWFWILLNLVFAALLAFIAVRFLVAWVSGRRPDTPPN
jgi:hypothetical protein